MRDKYLGKDGIEEKYNSRKDLIETFQFIGILGGSAMAITSVGSDVLGGAIAGGGIGTTSYFIGNYINKLNEKMKEKALKNIEQKVA